MNFKIGPLMLDLEGFVLTSEERELLRHPVVGGVILFARNIADPAQVRALCESVRLAAGRDLLIAVDQEGGRVQRLREGFTDLPSLQLLGQRDDPALTRLHGWLMASEVRAAGCDISFAPVLDLEVGRSRVIGQRSFGGDPAHAIRHARAYMEGMLDAGMRATGKHFPGHGYVEADSHVEIPVDEREELDIRASCLRVFRALADQLGAVMPAHVTYPAVDHRPAGFSPVWLREILRGELHFQGCVFSDALDMHGASVMGDFPARARAALEAGCDMVLVCNNRAGAIAVLDALPHQHDRDAQGRIAALRRHQIAPTLAELQRDPRWRAAHERLQALAVV